MISTKSLEKEGKQTPINESINNLEPYDHNTDILQQETKQYATLMDYETSDITETSLRNLYGDNYETKMKELMKLSTQESTILIDEHGRRITTESEEESDFSDGESPNYN